MKKVVFLVDTDNSKFLIVNNNDSWELPSLNIYENIDSKDIYEKYKKKFNHNIREIAMIEETKKYIFVKCLTDNKIFDAKKYKLGVINEIMPLITNKFHSQLLLNISAKIRF